MPISRIALLILLLSAGPASAGPQPQTGRKITPVDEAARDPVLARLRSGVLGAAERRSAALLAPFLADPVVVYSVNRAPAEFVTWFAAQPLENQARFWDALRDAFTLGMAYERGRNAPMLLAPYTGVALSEIPSDLTEHYAITASGVAVHRSPSDASPVIAHLDFDVVDVAPPTTGLDQPDAVATSEWRRIKTPSGQLGWVRSTYARSAYDTRFAIEKQDGAWKISGWAIGE